MSVPHVVGFNISWLDLILPPVRVLEVGGREGVGQGMEGFIMVFIALLADTHSKNCCGDQLVDRLGYLVRYLFKSFSLVLWASKCCE